MKKLFIVFGISVFDIFILLSVLSVMESLFQIDGNLSCLQLQSLKAMWFCAKKTNIHWLVQHYVSEVPVTEVVVNKKVGTYTL